MSKPAENIPQSTPHVVFADTKTPRNFSEWFSEFRVPKYSYALFEDSYPLMLIGSCGSGRSTAISSLLAQNIRDEKPFVYVNGEGDLAQFNRLYSYAESHNRTDDLFCLNFLTAGQGCSHTFDPINPLIGDEASFIALFGARFGSVLHQLCLCEKEAGDLVDTARLKSFLKLEHLDCLVDYSRYAPVKDSLSTYLDSLQGISQVSNEVMQLSARVCEIHNVSPRSLQHLMNLQRVSMFVEMLETLPIFSTAPVVDFAKLFKGNKFVVVLLPALEKDPDALGFMNTLLTCHLSQVADQIPKGSALPAAVFDGCFDTQSLSQSVMDRFAGTNTLFGYTYARSHNSTDYRTFEAVTRMAKAVICMRVEDGLSKCVLGSARSHSNGNGTINLRDLSEQRPGHGVAWGSMGAIRKGAMRKLIGIEKFVFRRVDIPQAKEINLTKKGLAD